MRNKIYGLLAIAAVAVGTASTASATSIPECEAASVAAGGNITMIGAQGCYVAGDPNVIFSNFVVSVTGAGPSSVSIAGDTDMGGDLGLDFQFAIGVETNPDSVDIEISYTVTGGLTGIDDSFQATPDGTGGNVTIDEVACAVPFTGSTGTSCPSPASNTLASYSDTSTGQSVSDSETFASTSPVYIKKDIDIADATMSEFTNTQDGYVPEPMTFSLIGMGLVGLGFMGRRRLRK